MIRKKGGGSGHDNLERWLLTYADMITLLMAFFILMYTMSQIDAAKMKDVSEGIRQQLSSPIGSLFAPITIKRETTNPLRTKTPPPIISSAQIVPATMKIDPKSIAKILDRKGFKGKYVILMSPRGMVIRMGASVLFDVNSEQVNPEGSKILFSLGEILAQLPNLILIEGHTDEMGTGVGTKFSPNWTLSANRAINVLGFLVKNDLIDDRRVTVSALASNKPLQDQNLSEEERRHMNRRVELIVTNDLPEGVREPTPRENTWQDGKPYQE